MNRGQERKLLPFFLLWLSIFRYKICGSMRWQLLTGVSVCLAVGLVHCPRLSNAAVTADEPGAIVIFPKIVSDQNQDTIIQISNAAGARVSVRCLYVNGAIDPGSGKPIWAVTDFQISLTRLQPASWVAGQGQPIAPPGVPPEFYPGKIPPVDVGFVGELRCVVVDENENPLSRNALTGDATLIDRTNGATRKYRAVAIQALSHNDGDNTLLLDDLEYSACPRMLMLNAFFDDAPDPVLSSNVETVLTIVPCSADFERRTPGSATVQFDVVNEFETRLSTSLSVQCFETIRLSDIDSQQNPSQSIFNFAAQGTLVGQIRILPVIDAATNQGHGVLAVAEEIRGGHASTTETLHFIEGNLQSDVIILPPGNF